MVTLIDKVFATAFLVGVMDAIVFLFSILAIASSNDDDTPWYTVLAVSAVIGLVCIFLALGMMLAKIWL